MIDAYVRLKNHVCNTAIVSQSERPRPAHDIAANISMQTSQFLSKNGVLLKKMLYHRVSHEGHVHAHFSLRLTVNSERTL